MDEIERIKKEVNLIRERNKKVEADKAWETSKFRIIFITVITYIIISFVFFLIGVKNFLLNALIPTIGYYLSTRSLSFIKKWWISKFFQKKYPANR